MTTTNTVDVDGDGRVSAFDVRVTADTRLPDADLSGPGEPYLEVRLDGQTVATTGVLERTRRLETTVELSPDDLPASGSGPLAVTVVLMDEDVVSDDEIARETLTVPYEATEAAVRLTATRATVPAGAPTYLTLAGASGTDATWTITAAPSAASPRVRTVRNGRAVLRAETPGTYTVTAETAGGRTATTTVTVEARSALIDRYAPVIELARGERYRPTRLEALVHNAVLETATGGTARPALPQLGAYGSGATLELRGGQDAAPAYDDAYPPTVYASVHNDVRFRGESYTAVTYWLFYVYDPKTSTTTELFAAHQSDLETVTVLVADGEAAWVGASQHYGGERRAWETVRTVDTHPRVYPAFGAHSMYLRATTAFDGAGLLPQDQFVDLPGEDPADQSTAIIDTVADVYVDRTGGGAVFSPGGERGTAYELVPLTGTEAWATYGGSLTPATGEAPLPMARDRWQAPGRWLETELFADEAQVRLSVDGPSVSVSGSGTATPERAAASVTVANVGPKPTRVHLVLEAKPAAAAWTDAAVERVAIRTVPLGTTVERTLSVAGAVPTDAAGTWDLRARLLTYPPDAAGPEDIRATTRLTGAYTVSEAGSTATLSPTSPTGPTTGDTETAVPGEGATETAAPGSSGDGGAGFGLLLTLVGLGVAVGGLVVRRRVR